jgi:hypothetical protein
LPTYYGELLKFFWKKVRPQFITDIKIAKAYFVTKKGRPLGNIYIINKYLILFLEFHEISDRITKWCFEKTMKHLTPATWRRMMATFIAQFAINYEMDNVLRNYAQLINTSEKVNFILNISYN